MLSEIERMKLDIFANGIKISDSAKKAFVGPMTMGEYASTSGISMELEGQIWVNAPFSDYNPNFVSDATITMLDYKNDSYYVKNGKIEIKAKPVPVPSYEDKKAKSGEVFGKLAVTHTDRVRISPVEGCAIACTFCNLPYEFKYRKKLIPDLVESVEVALNDKLLTAKHVLISGGTPKPEDYGYENQVYDAVAQAYKGIDVDIMMVPMPGLLDPVRLKEVGIHGLSINMELHNEKTAQKIAYSKFKVGIKGYLDFIENAVKIFGGRNGRVRSLLMLGLESLDDTLEGVEALAQVGCDPVLSPFRPDPRTPMKNAKPPSMEFMEQAYERSRDIVKRYPGVVLGPRCIPCMHNTLTFPDKSGAYFSY
jgi:radical SAM superfamily enzyme YgiQ (UPF0313 family)